MCSLKDVLGRLLCLTRLLVLLVLLVLLSPSDAQPAQDLLCRVECQGARERPVCGTDGITYKSRCELQKAVCEGGRVKYKQRGSCHTEADGSRCFQEKRAALKAGNESGIPIFVPSCSEDGNYRQVQCHKGTGYCWCVDGEGRPVPGSSVRHTRPLCHLLGVTGRWRRGKHRSREHSTRGRRRGDVCTQADRTAFSTNILDMISTQHSHSLTSRAGEHNGTVLGHVKKEVAGWKFAQLDTNMDGVLARKEMKVFREQTRKVVRPRKCGRSFLRYCDQDSDRRISRSEWNSCLGITENISFSLFSKLISEEDQERRSPERWRTEEVEQPKHSGTFLDKYEEEPQQQQDQAAPSDSSQQQQEVVKAHVDCETARLEATAEALSEVTTFVPECSKSGDYLAVQCYRSEGYCWCVEPTSGRPIPGTSTSHSRPTCEAGQTKTPRYKQWRKCSGEKRDVFLRKLFDWMTLTVVNSTVPYLLTSEPHLTLNQRLAKWQFISLDTNRNGVLEKKEVKVWKKAMRKVSGLTLCGKRIQQYCDINKDNSISQSEWTKCLDVAMEDSDPQVVTQATIRHSIGQRRGPNPLKTWLNDD